MRYCVFCGSYDVPEASATSTCIDCARLFRNIEDSLGAVAVAAVARDSDIEDAEPVSFETVPPGPITVRSLASIEAARKYTPSDGLETLKVPALSMNDIARATEARGLTAPATEEGAFDAQFHFPTNPAPPRVWTQPIPVVIAPLRSPQPQTPFLLFRARAKRSAVGLMGAFALGSIIAVGASQVPTSGTVAAGSPSFAPETESHEMAPVASPVVALRTAEAEAEKELAGPVAAAPVEAPVAQQVDELTRLERAVDANPNDCEALTGLGFLARAAGDQKIARTYFDRAVAANPIYLPAQLALADGAWNAGDRADATRRYTRIVGSFAPSTVPQRAKERAAQ